MLQETLNFRFETGLLVSLSINEKRKIGWVSNVENEVMEVNEEVGSK